MLAACFLALYAVIARAADWNSLLAEAGLLEKQGAYAQAEKKFRDALREAELFGSGDTRLALTLNNLGTLYRQQGKFDLAESHYRRALAIWNETNGPVATA